MSFVLCIALAGLLSDHGGPAVDGRPAVNEPRETVSQRLPAQRYTVFVDIRLRGVDDEDRMARAVHKRVAAALVERGWRVGSRPAAVRFAISVSAARDNAPNYHVRLSVASTTDSLAEVDVFDCMACGAEALLGAIEAHVAEFVPRLREIHDRRLSLVAPSAEPRAEPEVEPTAPVAVSTLRTHPSTTMIETGIVFTAFGIGAVLVGGVILALGAAPDSDDDRTALVVGAASVGVGVASLAVGAPLIAVGRKREHRRITTGLSVSRGSAGLTLRGRF